jgi:hypothetical protein
MFTINNHLAEFQRYQRGFGNRRALVTRLKHHYPSEILLEFDNLRDGKYLLSNPYETKEQNDIIHQEQQPIIYG